MTLRAVIDAQAWVSAALTRRGPARAIVDEFALEGPFTIVSSAYIHREILDVLARPHVAKRIARGFDAAEWLGLVELVAVEFAEEAIGPALSDDPKDDPYLWAAFVGGASRVVSWDADLLNVKHYRGIEVVTPETFLRELRRVR